MTLTHTAIEDEAAARLAEAHRLQATKDVCHACGQDMPCDTLVVLGERLALLEGFRDLQRQIPMTFATLAQANFSAAAARTVILRCLRRK